jgi:hypothetical protein
MELISLEPKPAARAKLGMNGQWLNVQDPAGDQGYVAAWFLSETMGQMASGQALPPGALAFVPLEELAFRSQPVINPGNLIRRVPVTETLICIEPASQAIPKVGQIGKWLYMSDFNNKEGYVAAWYVRYAGGSQPAATAPTSSNGVLQVKATVEAIALRKQPLVSDATLIKRLPLGTVLTVTEPNAEGKVGRNDQWLKVKDPTGTEGYVAAWFVAR